MVIRGFEWCSVSSLPLTFLISLESKLRSFACLTKGDIIGIEYNDKVRPWGGGGGGGRVCIHMWTPNLSSSFRSMRCLWWTPNLTTLYPL